jgi:hypothetical protein
MALVEELRDATWRNAKGIRDDRTANEVLQKCWTWDLLVKGDYREAHLPDVLRCVSPPKETRQAIATVCHKFLKATHFYRRVYSNQAEVSQEVKTMALVAKALARSKARKERREEMKRLGDSSESEDLEESDEEESEEDQWSEGYCLVEDVVGKAECKTTGEVRYTG